MWSAETEFPVRPGGGALWVGSGTARVRNSIFSDNAHVGIRQDAGSASFVNCTVTGNTHQGLEASTTASVTNCIFYLNYANGEQVYPSSLKIGYSCIQGGYLGTGNISFNPSLCPDNLSLLAGSPCIDAGDPGLEFRDGCVSTEDCSPYARGSTRNDMGAYGGPGVCNWTDPRPEPVIRINPDNAIVAVGRDAQMGVIATGDDPLSYQWFVGGNPVSDQTNSVLSLTNVQLTSVGVCTVVVSNALGSATSQPVQLMVSKLAVSAAGFSAGKPVLRIANGTAGTLCAIHAISGLTVGDTSSVPSDWPKIDTITLTGAETLWTDPRPLQASEQRFYGVVPLQ